MRTDATSTGRSDRPQAHLDAHATCTCGQELDVCSHAHCPRCGHRVGSSALLVAA